MGLHQFGGQNRHLVFHQFAGVLAYLGMCNWRKFVKCHCRKGYKNTLVVKIKKNLWDISKLVFLSDCDAKTCTMTAVISGHLNSWQVHVIKYIYMHTRANIKVLTSHTNMHSGISLRQKIGAQWLNSNDCYQMGKILSVNGDLIVLSMSTSGSCWFSGVGSSTNRFFFLLHSSDTCRE